MNGPLMNRTPYCRTQNCRPGPNRHLLRRLASVATLALVATAPAAPARAATVQVETAPAAAAPAKPATPRYGSWGIDLSARDPSVRPGDNFDAYVNGAWARTATIPADQTQNSSFINLRNLSLDQQSYVIASQGPETRIGGLYKSFMDEKTVETIGDVPLRKELAVLAALPDKLALARHMGATMGGFGAALVGLGIDADPADATRNVLWMGQSGLGMPDRDYYLEAGFKDKRAAYLAYIVRQLTLAGHAAPARTAADILAFETEVARLSWPMADRREIDKVINPMTFGELVAYAPGLDWGALLAGAGIGTPARIIVQEKTAIRDIAALYARTPIETLKAWQAFHIAHQAAPYLPRRYVESSFAYTKALRGTQQNEPRWKRANRLLDTALGELIGEIYVKDFFPARSKAMMEELVANLKVAMANRIVNNDWMEPATKMAALEKLARMDVMVGYPETVRDYSALRIEAGDLYGNVVRAGQLNWQYQLSHLDKPVDRKLWAMTPQTVNAYNGGLENKIVFPAAILQPPFFDPDADPAVNYGAIGMVIGHEISHGFDDQGRKIDATGTVRDWWTENDARRFQAEADKFGAQYDSYEPVPGMRINGKLTMGENIADLAGALIALDAYRASLKGKAAPVIDGTTGEQRFFLATGQVWRSKVRPDAIKEQLASDPHSPAAFRIIGPTRNIDAWYTAFDVADGTYHLPPAERVRIW
jgi:putative endopeptidase